MTQKATIFLDDGLRESAAKGQHNFIGHLIGTLQDEGYAVDLAPEAAVSHSPLGRGITHMTTPPIGGLTFRRVYHYPFWSIETTSDRWDRDVAKIRFSPDSVSKPEADQFYRRWQNRLFPDTASDASRDGFVYVPLQGRLSSQRSFQSCAPLEMVRLTLQAERDRDIVAALHPKETYTDAERAALQTLADNDPRLSIRTGGMEELLRGCDYVVTMNSAAAFNGYFFGKPCIQFGRIDFHHIALSASPDDLSAFDNITTHTPAGYLLWFWQQNSINAGRPDVRDQIRAALIRCDWPVKA